MKGELKSVQHVQASHAAFAAILAVVSVVTWGNSSDGDSSGVQDQLHGKQQIQASHDACAAIVADGSVVTGETRAPAVTAAACKTSCKACSKSKLVVLHLLQADGSVVAWANAFCGGDSSSVQDQPRIVQRIHASHDAFAAILPDRSVVTWASSCRGGDSSSVQDQLRSVQQLQANAHPRPQTL